MNAAFVDRWGERRIYDSVKGLDRRTVAKIFHCRGGVQFSSLQVLFADCHLPLEEADYHLYLSAAPVATEESDPDASLLTIGETVGGAMPLMTKFYIQRQDETLFRNAIQRRDGIIRIKGPRQTGKTTLLAQGLEQARQAKANVVVTDFRCLDANEKQSIESLYLTLAHALADQLNKKPPGPQNFPEALSAGMRFRQYLKKELLGEELTPLFWGIDDADALFDCSYHSSFFTLMRSLFEDRSKKPAERWDRLTILLTYSTEAHLFIPHLNMSPFNVGERFALQDFTLDQVRELNRRYQLPLDPQTGVFRLMDLVGGHPFLAHLCLYEITNRLLTLDDIEAEAEQDDGIFGEHLDRMRQGIAADADLTDAVKRVLNRELPLPNRSFLRLRSAGVITGASEQETGFRCRLYAQYLKRHFS